MITYQYGHKIMIIIITTKTKYKIKNKMQKRVFKQKNFILQYNYKLQY